MDCFIGFTKPIEKVKFIGECDAAPSPAWTPDQALQGVLPQLWMDASHGVNSGSVADGDAVSAWVSRDANALSFTQATGTKQPLYRASAINGHPGIDFDGTDDILVKATANMSGQIGTAVIIFHPDLVNANGHLFTQVYNVGVATWFGFRYDAVGRIVQDSRNNLADAGAVSMDSATGLIVAGNNYCAFWESNGTVENGRLNGSPYTITPNTGSNDGRWWSDITNGPPNQMSIGARRRSDESQFTNGKICEILFYPVNLDAENIAILDSYIFPKYGVHV